MSTTYSFVCDDCKVIHWSGQRSGERSWIYGNHGVAEFLYDHVGCKLRFLNDDIDDEKLDCYEEYRYDNSKVR